jgi:uncharacterized membrane protein
MGVYIQAIIYIAAGMMHFIKPRPYLSMMPPWLPNPELLVLLSGVGEVAGGVGLLFPQTRSAAAWGLMLLLIAIFPANIYMAITPKFWKRFPRWALWVRLPLQFLLIWWAYRFT